MKLFVTDIPARKIHVLDSRLNCLRTISIGRVTTAMTWEEDGSIMLFHEQGAISRLQADDSIRLVFAGLPDEVHGIFNDVIADPVGRVLAGTQPVENRLGRLYIFDRDLRWRILLDDVHEPNGLAFSTNCKRLYFSDSVRQIIWKFDYDMSNGNISNQRCFFQTSGEILPDGLTVDEKDNVWIALWEGAQIICLASNGQVLDRIPLPAQCTSSVTYGGEDMSSIYVTSARASVIPEKRGEFDGAVFRIDNCGRGRPEFPSGINT